MPAAFPFTTEETMMEHPFLRCEMLWGPEAQQRLAQSHVILFGLGGVGSYVAESLARAGVGALTLVDNDTVALTNLNRQLEALHSTLGKTKAQAVADRLRDINPDLRLYPMCATYDAAHRDDFFPPDCGYDYIVDAIDLVSCKIDLVETAGGCISPSSWPWAPAISWTPPCCGSRTSPRPTAALWPGSCARNCASEGWSMCRWYSVPRRG